MNPLKQLAKNVIRNATRPRFRPQDTIALTGTPRSGTTWIAEILQQRLALDVINEPLHLTRSPNGKDHGFDWMTCIEQNDHRPECAQYLKDVITGKISAGWHAPFQGSHLTQIFGYPRKNLLVKFVRANRFLGWLAKQIEFAAIVYVVRHPCAVIASKIAMGKRENSPWAQFKPPAPDNIQMGFDGRLPDRIVEQYGDTLRSAKTTAGALACMWALDNHLASQDWNHQRCMLVSYEHLTLNSIVPLFAALETHGFQGSDNQSAIDTAQNASAKPSNVASPDLAVDDPAKQLSKWKNQLTTEEIDEILHIVNGFGLTCFTDNPVPDFEKLSDIFQGAKLIA